MPSETGMQNLGGVQEFTVNFFRTFYMCETFHKKMFGKKKKIQPCNFRVHGYFRNQIQALHFKDDKTAQRRSEKVTVPEAAQQQPPDPPGSSSSCDLDQGPGEGMLSQHSAQWARGSTPDPGLSPREQGREACPAARRAGHTVQG